MVEKKYKQKKNSQTTLIYESNDMLIINMKSGINDGNGKPLYAGDGTYEDFIERINKIING